MLLLTYNIDDALLHRINNINHQPHRDLVPILYRILSFVYNQTIEVIVVLCNDALKRTANSLLTLRIQSDGLLHNAGHDYISLTNTAVMHLYTIDEITQNGISASPSRICMCVDITKHDDDVIADLFDDCLDCLPDLLMPFRDIFVGVDDDTFSTYII